MRRVFVFEYLTGGGARTGDDAAADARDADAALAAMGRAMRDAMVGDLLAGAGFSVSVAVDNASDDDLPAAAHAVRSLAGESAFDFVARQAPLHDFCWAVAPETGGVLARLCRSVAPARWLGCSPAAIRLAGSKRATLLRLAGRGLPTPLAFERSPGVVRWIVKPDAGAGAVATRVHPSRAAAWADADRRARAGETASVEAFIEGDALSLSLLCHAGGAELLSINRQRLSVAADGALSFEGVDVNAIPVAPPGSASGPAVAADPSRPPAARGPVLADLARQTAQAVPGLRGFVGIDLVWHAEHGPVLIEINPRVTCAYVGLSTALGRNLAAELVAHADALAAPETVDAAA